jgi:hypothetical protein
MGAITTTCTYREAAPNLGVKSIIVTTPNTADTGDTIVITLADYGIGTLLAVEGFVHTTENSVIVAEAPTTSVTSGVLTITIGGSTVSDKKRVFRVTGI